MGFSFDFLCHSSGQLRAQLSLDIMAHYTTALACGSMTRTVGGCSDEDLAMFKSKSGQKCMSDRPRQRNVMQSSGIVPPLACGAALWWKQVIFSKVWSGGNQSKWY